MTTRQHHSPIQTQHGHSGCAASCGAARGPLSWVSRASRLLLCLATALVLWLALATPAPLAPLAWAATLESGKELAARLQAEQARAKARQASLSRLSGEERGIDADLAAAEQRILAVETALAGYDQRLSQLAQSDISLQQEYDTLRLEQQKTEKAMGQVLELLWELHSRRMAVGGRDLPDWHVTDREHTWSSRLLPAFDSQRKLMAVQSLELQRILGQREKLAEEIHTQRSRQNKEKEQLLQLRLNYAQRLAALRYEKNTAETELAAILELVASLDLQLQKSQEQGDLAQAKGKLPLPLAGSVRIRFAPNATPPVRGITLVQTGDDAVKAVHWGKVVHNDVLRGFGRVVILMHGTDYYSLYAFLSESPVTVGQEIIQGQPLGKAGFVPAINSTGLYFELRFQQKAINPELWFRA